MRLLAVSYTRYKCSSVFYIDIPLLEIVQVTSVVQRKIVIYYIGEVKLTKQKH